MDTQVNGNLEDMIASWALLTSDLPVNKVGGAVNGIHHPCWAVSQLHSSLLSTLFSYEPVDL